MSFRWVVVYVEPVQGVNTRKQIIFHFALHNSYHPTLESSMIWTWPTCTVDWFSCTVHCPSWTTQCTIHCPSSGLPSVLSTVLAGLPSVLSTVLVGLPSVLSTVLAGLPSVKSTQHVLCNKCHLARSQCLD